MACESSIDTLTVHRVQFFTGLFPVSYDNVRMISSGKSLLIKTIYFRVAANKVREEHRSRFNPENSSILMSSTRLPHSRLAGGPCSGQKPLQMGTSPEL